MQRNTKTTLIRAETNYGARDQDIRFAEVYNISPQMRGGCRLATRSVMAGGEMVHDLGLGQPVRVSVNSDIHGKVATAIGLIAYQDESYDNLFFIYVSKRGELSAVMGDTYDISRAIEGWLDYFRYFKFAWDPVARERNDVFAVDGFECLWCDRDGVISGADVAGAVVTVSKLHLHDSYDRIPESKLLRIGVQAQMHRAMQSEALKNAR